MIKVKKIFVIDIGDMQLKEAEKFVQKVLDNYKKRLIN